jgi:hypothetical protein
MIGALPAPVGLEKVEKTRDALVAPRATELGRGTTLVMTGAYTFTRALAGTMVAVAFELVNRFAWPAVFAKLTMTLLPIGEAVFEFTV